MFSEIDVRIDLWRQQLVLRIVPEPGLTMTHCATRSLPAALFGLGGFGLPGLYARQASGRYLRGDGEVVAGDAGIPLSEAQAAQLRVNSQGQKLYGVSMRTPELLILDESGRHVATRHGVTGLGGVDITYHPDGSLAEVRSPYRSVAFIYDVHERVIVVDGRRVATIRLDGSGRAVEVVMGRGALAMTYRGDGHLTRLEGTALPGPVDIAYDDQGRVVSVLDPQRGLRTVAARTWSRGREVLLVEGLERERRVTESLDPRGRLVRQGWCCGTPPVVHYSTGWRRTQTTVLPDGSALQRRLDRRGKVTWRRSLTPAGLAVEMAISGSLSFDLRQDAPVRTVTMRGSDRALTLAYDRRERRLDVREPGSQRRSVTFDELGRPVGVARDSGPKVELRYGKDGRSCDVDMVGFDGSRQPHSRTWLVSGRPRGVYLPQQHLLVSYEEDLAEAESRLLPGGATAFRLLLGTHEPKLLLPDGRSRTLLESGRYVGDGGPAADGMERTVKRESSLSGTERRLERWAYSDQAWQVVREAWPGRVLEASSESFSQQRSYDGPWLTSDRVDGIAPVQVRYRYRSAGRLAAYRINGAKEREVGPHTRTRTRTHTRTDARVGPVSVTSTGDGADGGPAVSVVAVEAAMRYAERAGQRLAVTYAVQGRTVLYQEISFDGFDRVTRVHEVLPAAGEDDVSFAYDSAGRIAQVARARDVTAYEYGPDRTLVRVRSGATDTEVESDTFGRVVRYGASECSWTEDGRLRRVTGAQAADYQYDGRGLLRFASAGDRRYAFEYDVLGRLCAATGPEGSTVGYAWDPLGRLLATVNPAGDVITEYVYPSGRRTPDAVRLAGHWYLCVVGVGDTIRALVNPRDGAVLDVRRHDVFGVDSERAGQWHPLGFAGGLEFVELGLVWLGSRWYRPQVGMWLTPDPLGIRSGEPNLHAYVGNDPVNRVDHSGGYGVKAGFTGGGTVLGGYTVSAGVRVDGERGVQWFIEGGARGGTEASAGFGGVVGYYEDTHGDPVTGYGITTPAVGGEWYRTEDDAFTGLDVSVGPTLGGGVHKTFWNWDVVLMESSDLPDPTRRYDLNGTPWPDGPPLCAPEGDEYAWPEGQGPPVRRDLPPGW